MKPATPIPKWVYLLLIACLAGVGWLIYRQMSKVDWKETYSYKEKKPYGTQVIFDLLPAYFGTNKPEIVKESAFNRFIYDLSQGGLYVIVSPKVKMDSLDAVALKQWISRGNQALIVTRDASSDLKAMAGVLFEGDLLPLTEQNRDTVRVWVGDSDLPSWHLPLKSTLSVHPQDSSNQEVILKDERTWSIGVRIAIGEGNCWIISRPEYFSNYHLLRPESKGFMADMLGQLTPPETLLWDDYYRQLVSQKPPQPPRTSFLDYILSQPGLSGAFWLALIGLAIYLLLGSRRIQRLIPIILPRKNSSLEFADTIGRLYFREGNHRNLAQKRMRFWFDFLRNRYRIQSDTLDDAFVKRVSAKSGADESLVKTLLAHHQYLQKLLTTDENTLIEIARDLDLFYEQTKAGTHS